MDDTPSSIPEQQPENGKGQPEDLPEHDAGQEEQHVIVGTDNTVTMVRLAAIYRAAGMSWEFIAKEFGKAPRTCRDWPHRHREIWEQQFNYAWDRICEEAGSEAMIVIRQLLRDEDKWLRLRSAQAILNHIAKRVPKQIQLSGPAGGPLRVEAGISDAQLVSVLQSTGDWDLLPTEMRDALLDAAGPNGRLPGLPAPEQVADDHRDEIDPDAIDDDERDPDDLTDEPREL